MNEEAWPKPESDSIGWQEVRERVCYRRDNNEASWDKDMRTR